MQGRRASSIILAGAGVVGGWAVASPAGAEDTRTTAPYEQCRTVKDGDTELGLGCFDPDGDVFGAHDYVNDGRRVVTSWQTDYGRSGQCYNAKGADEHSSGWSHWMLIG